MLREKLLALIVWLETKDRTLPDSWKPYTLYRSFYSSFRYLLYLGVTGNSTASYVVSRPPQAVPHSSKDGWKSYLVIILLMCSGYLMVDVLLLWNFLNSPVSPFIDKTVIEFSWDSVRSWASSDRFELRDVLTLAATVVGLYLLNRRTKANDKQTQLAEEGLDIDRFYKGSEMLADDHASVRQAGIVSLKNLALSRPKEYGPQVLSVLTHFLKKPDSDSMGDEIYDLKDRPDVHFAFRTTMEIWQNKTIRKWHLRINRYLDMNGVRLSGGYYRALDFQFVSFIEAEFVQVSFIDISFFSTVLVNMRFERCDFGKSSFVASDIYGTEFRDCSIYNVNWNSATFAHVAINHEWDFPPKDELRVYKKLWLDRVRAAFEGVWICSVSGAKAIQMNETRYLGYKIVEESCGSLVRIRFVETAPTEE